VSDIAMEGFGPSMSPQAPPMVPDPVLIVGKTPTVNGRVYAPEAFSAHTAPAVSDGAVIEFWLPGPFFNYREKRKDKVGRLPSPKGRGKVARIVPGKGFATVTDAPSTVAAEKALVDALTPLAPPAAWACPVRLDVDFVFTPPTSGPAWMEEACLANAVHVTSDSLGDRDNLHKMLGDAMEKAGFYVRDSAIVEGDVRKLYGPEPGYRVKMTALHDVSSFSEWKARKASG